MKLNLRQKHLLISIKILKRYSNATLHVFLNKIVQVKQRKSFDHDKFFVS